MATKNISGHDLWSVVGLAFLWPCLQSSGFYPFSLALSAASASADTVARGHLVYSIVLLLLFALILALRNRLEEVFCSSARIPLIFGTAGILGQALLVFADMSGTWPGGIAMIGALLTALFIAVFVVLWGCRFSSGPAVQTMVKIACSYAISQIVLVVYFALNLPQGILLCACALGTAVCAAVTAQASTSPKLFHVDALKQLPLGMIIFVTLLIYFCIIYVRMQLPAYTGDTTASNKLMSAALCAFAAVMMVLYLIRKQADENSYIAVFIIVVSLYTVGLAIMALFFEGSSVRRVLIAAEHCAEVFLWMALAFTSSRKNISPTLLFALYGVIIVTIPWVLSFDLYYLTPLAENLATDSIANAVVIIMLCVTTLGTIAVLTSYTLRFARESRQLGETTYRKNTEKAFESVGLTERELDIALLIYRGYSAKKIAEQLFLSESTVKNYSSRIYRKLGIHTKQELIAYVDDQHLL